MVSAPLTNFQINWIFKATGCFPALRGAVAGHSTMAINLSIPILVVEDYNTVIRIIRNRLRQLGFKHIDKANDGTVAFTKMRRRPFGLVISDWNMEPMTGYDLLQEVRSDPGPAGTSFIMVTAETKTENVIAAKTAGVSNYIVKPFNAQTLKSKIDAVFAKWLRTGMRGLDPRVHDDYPQLTILRKTSATEPLHGLPVEVPQ
jgi:two-component system chemotaxis response regulator CheY